MVTTKKKKNNRSIIDKQFVFNSDNINEIIEKQHQGFALPRHMNPWFKNQAGVRRAGLVWAWSEEELEDFARCAFDIHYFANKFCKIKSEDGQIRQMTVRDYQVDVLNAYTKNRFTINMSSRQTGKCTLLVSNVLVKIDGVEQILPLFKLYWKYKETKSFYDYLKYPFYWLLWKLNK